MTIKIGSTMMSEQAGPKQLTRDIILFEEAGSDFCTPSAAEVTLLAS
jgi:hypothetical protein